MVLADLSSLKPTPEIAKSLVDSFGVFVATIVLRALTKLKDYGDPTPTGIAKRKEANFDIARNGLDLSLLGLTTYLTIFEVTWKKSPSDLGNLADWNFSIIIGHVVLLGTVVWLTAFYNKHSDNRWMSVGIPMILGFISVGVSTFLFVSVAHLH
jgi:hypothetical protein